MIYLLRWVGLVVKSLHYFILIRMKSLFNLNKNGLLMLSTLKPEIFEAFSTETKNFDMKQEMELK